MFPLLEPVEEKRVTRKSSLQQYEGKTLTVNSHNYQMPVCFDLLDFVDPRGGIRSHKIVIDFGKLNGYNYRIRKETSYTDDYVLFDHEGTEVRLLPEWFGKGFYKEHVNEKVLVTGTKDNIVGVRNKLELYSGTDYVTCDNPLPVVK